ncbi:myb-like protein AA [Cephus cinctus]|uniref:Myb-like protein AA n=1 Tax=Cephus cinctus TaxID=211228 RepID=A0AAJ7RBQ5_CEPCN|nr:myb-like protein AA [Cephus cinctus]XP_024938007.1 myb-like protein AA [Cephus cinctus]
MTEGGTSRMKRNGARLFKNPPQPHMCIQDYRKGFTEPCYVNVLSWGKIAMPHSPSDPIPLYGGMRVSPPRTENPQMAVFAVMVNPEILRLNGKNAQDPKERSTLIELLLDFVEAMNEDVVFTRRYTVLKDRDITGELKEVWMAVQAKRDREQPPQQETWIDAQPPVPQYPQSQDQWQQQQRQQQQQQQEYVSQPPQYQTSVSYGRVAAEVSNYDGYGHQPQNVPQNDQVYQSRQILAQQYHGIVSQITQDRYNYRERGRQNASQNQSQQNCPAYPAPQYQFQQLPRQMLPQYVNSIMHPPTNPNYGPANSASVNPGMSPNVPGHYQQYIPLQQQMVGQRQIENAMHADVHRMQQQIHVNHMQPVPQYEPSGTFNVQASSSMNVLRLGRPHMGVAQKNNSCKRQSNSPTHSTKQLSCVNCQSKDVSENGTKPKSPVKVLQREPPLSNDRQSFPQSLSPDKTKSLEKGTEDELDPQRNVQVTDLDEDLAKGKDASESVESTKKQREVSLQESTVMSRKEIDKNDPDESENTRDKYPTAEARDESSPSSSSPSSKSSKTRIMVLKRNKSGSEFKVGAKDPKIVKNGGARHADQQIYEIESERLGGREKDADEQFNHTLVELERKLNDSRNGFVGKQKTGESPKRSQTVNNIIKSVFKIHPGTSNNDDSSKRRTNGQNKSNGKSASNDNDDVYQGYTILRKAETTQEDVMSEIAQISIQDCKDTSEVSAVLS